MLIIDQPAIGKGIILGTLFSILNFVLMAQAVPAAVMNSKKAAILRRLQSIGFRYALMGGALYIGLKFDNFNFFAVAGGLYAVQAMILVDHLVVAPIANRISDRVVKP